MASPYILALLVGVFHAATSTAQIDPEKHGVFRIYTPKMAQGTAFVIAEPVEGTKLLATAAHIVQTNDDAGNPKKGSRYGGKVFSLNSDFGVKADGAECVAQDDEADIAIVAVKMDRDFTILPILDMEGREDNKLPSPEYSPSGKLVKFHGYGSGKWEVTKGFLCFIQINYNHSDGICVPGQSGGPMTLDGSIIGVVSGGAAWYPYKENGKLKNCTWPARAGSAKRLLANLRMVMGMYERGELK